MIEGPSITVEYSCAGCDIALRPIEVRERAAGEDLSDWLDLVKHRIGLDHAETSPACTSAEMHFRFHVRTGRVGEATRQ